MWVDDSNFFLRIVGAIAAIGFLAIGFFSLKDHGDMRTFSVFTLMGCGTAILAYRSHRRYLMNLRDTVEKRKAASTARDWMGNRLDGK